MLMGAIESDRCQVGGTTSARTNQTKLSPFPVTEMSDSLGEKFPHCESAFLPNSTGTDPEWTLASSHGHSRKVVSPCPIVLVFLLTR